MFSRGLQAAGFEYKPTKRVYGLAVHPQVVCDLFLTYKIHAHLASALEWPGRFESPYTTISEHISDDTRVLISEELPQDLRNDIVVLTIAEQRHNITQEDIEHLIQYSGIQLPLKLNN